MIITNAWIISNLLVSLLQVADAMETPKAKGESAGKNVATEEKSMIAEETSTFTGEGSVSSSSEEKGAVGKKSDSHELMDFAILLNSEEDKILIWTVENNKPIPSEVTDYSLFLSDKAYIILQGNSKVIPEYWNLYYWVGENTLYTDAGDTAFHTVHLDSKIHSRIDIHKEAEGQESRDFKEIFKRNGVRVLDQHAKRMFLIEENDGKIDFKEVELSLSYTQENNNCLVFSSQAMYVYCGSDVTDKQKRAAKELVKILLRKRGLNIKEVTIHRSNTSLSKTSRTEKKNMADFIEELKRIPEEIAKKEIVENPDEFKPEEERKILGLAYELEENRLTFNIKMVQIYEDYYGKVREGSKPNAPLNMLLEDDCYIMDSKSDLGLYVWVGKKSKIEKRQEAAKRAERYLKLRKYSRKMPIYFIHQENVPPEASTPSDLFHLLILSKSYEK